ncbi:MAG: hypothetical protein QT00_C0002G0328 [archaeon GW2011_AR5]|nr:MAG: hypothetical protein QT00_C0002G0328 [archaeon GW2011_AR5]
MVKMKKNVYMAAIIFTSLIFFVGILLGSRITDENTARMQRELQNDFLGMQSLELELSIVNNVNRTSFCSYIDYRLPDIVRQKVELGRRFDIGDIPSDQAEVLKKQYLLSLSKYWLFSEVSKKQCRVGNPGIVFFFDSSEASREQGRILDYLVYKSDENITVFAFNTEWDEPLMRLVMISYNVTGTPTVVIDDVSYSGLQTREKLAETLCKNYNLTLC